jgi:D-alanyl-D-alanine carboxypeptidase
MRTESASGVALSTLAVVMLATSCRTESVAIAKPTAPSPLVARIDAIVEAARSAEKIPGVTLLVEHRGKRIVAAGYGFADVENQVPADLDTVYQIASLTKQFTAAAILQLVEQKKLALDDDVTHLVPSLRIPESKVTVHHLLSHTHGIVEYNRDETRAVWPTAVDHAAVLALLAGHDLEFQPGTKFAYRNSGYYLLGMIIERLSGLSYADYLRTRIFEPLGMRSTSQCTSRGILPKRAHGYTLNDGMLGNASFLDLTWTFAVGSICSTAPDVLRWQHALPAGEVISRESYARMITPVTLSDGTVTDYGYGLGLSVHGGHRLVRHGGNTVGFSSYLTRYPDDDLIVVLLTNSDHVVAWKLEDEIGRAVLGLTPGQPSELGH